MALSEVTGNGASEIVIKGKPYKMSQVTIDDLTKIEQKLKLDRNRNYLQYGKELGMSNKEILSMTSRAIADDERDAFMGTIEGIQFLLSMILTRNNPGIEASTLIGEIPLDDLQTISYTIMGASPDDENANPTEPAAV